MSWLDKLIHPQPERPVSPREPNYAPTPEERQKAAELKRLRVRHAEVSSKADQAIETAMRVAEQEMTEH
jgi:hypothetical protein